jgi:hypothetical protein
MVANGLTCNDTSVCLMDTARNARRWPGTSAVATRPGTWRDGPSWAFPITDKDFLPGTFEPHAHLDVVYGGGTADPDTPTAASADCGASFIDLRAQ